MSRPRGDRGPILVLGASGLLGHQLVLSGRRRERAGHRAIVGSVRSAADVARWPEIFDADRDVVLPDATDLTALADLVDRVAPSVVVNAIGLVKQRDVADVDRRRVNEKLPHRLATLCDHRGAALLQVSTDCVFDGSVAPPRDETVVPDPVDEYGRSKLAGEVVSEPHLTVRTSFVGRELQRSSGLVEWLLSQRGGAVNGWRGARFSGLCTPALADLLLDAIDVGVWGLRHVAADPIDKYALLEAVAEAFELDVDIAPLDEPVVDRVLDGSLFAREVGPAPGWTEMIEALVSIGDYERWRSSSLE